VKEMEVSVKNYFKFNNMLKYKNSKKGQFDPILDLFQEEIEILQSYLPLFQILGNQDLKPRHWKQIFESLNHSKTYLDVSFNHLLSLDIVSKQNELEEISNRASGEQLIEMQLENIQKIWANLNFSIVNYADYKNQYRISGVDEILTNIDDNLLSLQTMLGNKFVV
jgi:hypothetical protein